MVNHTKDNIGKEFLYILPIRPYPHKIIKDYIVCIVEVVKVFNRYCECLIKEVLREKSGNGIYNYYKQIKHSTGCSNKYLYAKELI